MKKNYLSGITRGFMRKIKKILIISLILIALPVLFVFFSNYAVVKTTKSKIYTDIKVVPANDIGLVLGTSKYTIGGINLYYKYRIEAAAELFFNGKIKHIIVSGDNHVNGYNEPEQMKASLIKLGVPADKITCDYAGIRTLDSVVRLKKIFGTNKATIISQKFHLERALFIANYYRMDAIGYCSKDAYNRHKKSMPVREFFARPKAVLDLYILKTQPKHLGAEIKINI